MTHVHRESRINVLAMLFSCQPQNMKPPLSQLHPLFLPEILERIGSSLDLYSVTVSLRVCHTWHANFGLVLWRRFSWLDKGYPSLCDDLYFYYYGTVLRKHAEPTIEQILAKARYIRSFDMFHVSPTRFDPALSPALNRLVSFKTLCNSEASLQIIHHSRFTLASIDCASMKSLGQVNSVTTSDRFWDIVNSCEALNSLDLDDFIMPSRASLVFTTWHRLTRLFLKITNIANLPSKRHCALAEFSFPKLQELSLITIPDSRDAMPFMASLLTKSPNIRRLQCQSHPRWLTYPDNLPQFLLAIEPLLSNLRHFRLVHSFIDDSQMSKLLSRMTNLLRLQLTDHSFGSDCYQFIVDPKNQFWSAQIEELGLHSCRSVTSAMAHQLLITCTGLRHFRAPFIDLEDMTILCSPTQPHLLPVLTSDACQVQNFEEATMGSGVQSPDQEPCRFNLRAWNTPHLESLRISFRIRQSIFSLDEARTLIYTQLSRLTRLRHLQLGEKVKGGDKHTPKESCIDWTLKNGLYKLESLTELRTLSVKNLRARATCDDVAWMMKMWPHWVKIEGALSSKTDEERKIREQIEKRYPR